MRELRKVRTQPDKVLVASPELHTTVLASAQERTLRHLLPMAAAGSVAAAGLVVVDPPENMYVVLSSILVKGRL